MKIRVAVLAIVLSAVAAADSFAYKIAVWIPPWNSKALTSIQNNASAIQESNPVWYSLNADGSIAKNWNAENATWRAAMSGTELIPTIQNVVGGKFDASVVVNLISTADGRERHAEAIAQLVSVNAFHGIDVDYERIPTSARANFTAFIARLSEKLHATGKKLSVTVYAKTSDQQNWDGPGSQDWSALGQLADTIKIMAYDYSWSTSAAGPIAPLGWIDSVTGYATSVIPAAKVIVGMPFYGYDWVGTSGRGIDYAQAMETAKANNATITRDANFEPTYTYSNHTVFFQDATSYAKKIEILKQKYPNVGGFAHWAAGQEDPEIWNVIRGGTPNSGTSPGTPALADFRVDGPASLSVTQGESTSGQYTLTAINGFSGTASVSASITGGLSAVPSSTTVAAGSAVSVRIDVPRHASTGTYTMTVRFTSNGVTRETLTSVTVQAAPKRKARSAGK